MTRSAAARPMPATAAHSDLPVLDMVRPMIGFPELRRFALERLDETGVLCELRSLEEPELRFVVAPPAVFFPDYAPEVGDDVSAALEAETAEDLFVLSVVSLGRSAEDATANLLAPLVVNHRTRRAAQVLLEDQELPLRAPLAGR